MRNEQSDADSEEDDPTTDDSGVEENSTKLASPADDGSMDFISKILEWSEERIGQFENVEDNRKYVLFMIKTFDCPHLGCIEHPSWGITVKRVEGCQTFEDIQDDNEMLFKLEKWVKKLTENILPTSSEIDFITTIFGRR